MVWKIKILLLCMLLIAGVANAGAVYRWVDSSGEVHFGDRPIGVDAELIKNKVKHSQSKKTGDSETIKRLERQQELVEKYKKQRIEDKKIAAKAKQEKLAQAKKCSKAQNRLARFQHARYLYEKSGDGERRVLDDAQRSTAEKDASLNVKRLCG